MRFSAKEKPLKLHEVQNHPNTMEYTNKERINARFTKRLEAVKSFKVVSVLTTQFDEQLVSYKSQKLENMALNNVNIKQM